jgi:hypothetical protein
MRADHRWPQLGQSYHAITHELSAVGATRRPQSGQFIEAVAESNLDMPWQEQRLCRGDAIKQFVSAD